MKKFLALALAIIMMAAIAVPAFAATIDETTNPQTATTTVTYGVSQSYVVTVPDAVDFAQGNTKTATVSASEVVIPGNRKLQVAIASAAGEYTVPNSSVVYDAKVAWTMVENTKNGSAAVPYTVNLTRNKTGAEDADFENVEKLANNGVVLTVLSNDADLAGESTLYFDTIGTNQAGQYTDTLTFTVSLEVYTA